MNINIYPIHIYYMVNIEGGHAGTLDGAHMHEHIGSALIGGDEAVALLGVEELDLAVLTRAALDRGTRGLAERLPGALPQRRPTSWSRGAGHDRTGGPVVMRVRHCNGHTLARRVALRRIAVLNGVVLVSYFNQLHAEGLALRDCVVQGCQRRLRPVLMTASITAFGLIPLLLATGPGSEIQRPLAIVVIGGLITATALTLILLPVLYLRHGRPAPAGLATPEIAHE